MIYENPYSEENGYVKSNSESEAVMAGFDNLYNTAEATGFDREYGFVVYQYNEGNEYGESSDYYWTSVINPGWESSVDPNNTKIPWDCVTVVSEVHLHVDNDPREVNGGFSGKDITNMKIDYEKAFVVIFMLWC